MRLSRAGVAQIGFIVACVLLFAACLFVGQVDIPARDVIDALFAADRADSTWRVIVCDARLPMAITAMLAGAALSVAGLLLQTTFNNPLAGPSILGISTGASLGVAIFVLGFGTAGVITSMAGAMAGAFVVLLFLLAFARLVRSAAMLLIVGIMVGYFASSGISLLNFFAANEGAVQAYVVWGLGSFSAVSTDTLGYFAIPLLVTILSSFLLIKPLDAMLLGDRYAASIGVDIPRARTAMIALSGLLTALVTAFCGPIGFVGLIVPHVARMATASGQHSVLLPTTLWAGASIGLLCAFLSVLPVAGVLPVNAITPVIGVPVILYIILQRKRLHYFN